MRIAVISDLHLAPGATNRCTTQELDLVRLFDRLASTHERVIAAGDLADLDRPRRPGGWRRHWERVRQAHPAAFARLDTFDMVWGNHDYQLQALGVPEEREFVVDDLRIIVLHGHQWDMTVKKVPGLPQTANFVAGWLQRARLDPLADALNRAPSLLDHATDSLSRRQLRSDRGQRGAAQLIDSGWDLVVAGHTHQLRLVPHGGGLYANSGAICAGTLDYISVDTHHRSVEAWRDDELLQRATRPGARWIVEAA